MVTGMPVNQRWAAMNRQAWLNTMAFHKLIPAVNSGAPVDGTSGTNVGLSAKGTLLTDETNGILYINTGTLASPTWTKVGTQT